MARKRSKTKGAAKLIRLLRKLPEEVTAEVKDAVAESAFALYADAYAKMPKPGSGHPYSDGTLQKRFLVKFSKDGLKARIGSWGRGRAAHIHLVEFGAAPHKIEMPGGEVIDHPGAPAQPFLMPAYETNRTPTIRRVRAAVSRALKRAIAEGKGKP